MKGKFVFLYFLIIVVLTNKCFANDWLFYCRWFTNDLEIAEANYEEYKMFTDFLIQRGIVTKPDDPAALFFSKFPLDEETNELYEDSTFIINLSKKVAESIFKNNLPRGRDLRVLLALASTCFRSVFEEFCVNNKEYKCDTKLRYRPIDGFCNDPNRPKEGAARTAYASLLYQNYDDSIQTLRKTIDQRKTLPSSRVISNTFFNNCFNFDVFIPNAPNMGSIMFGQLSTHDVSFRNSIQKQEGGPDPACCKADFSGPQPKHLLHPYCEPITIPEDDSFFKSYNYRCMNFVRSQNVYDNDCLLTSRKQLNLVTSMLDLSVIYGNSQAESIKLRTLESGKLKTNAQDFFPQDSDGNSFTGDIRFSQTPVLALLHILFIREHNRICGIIKSYKPDLSDEVTFQEARRYVIAEYQHIFLYEWWPIFSNGVERPLAFNYFAYQTPLPTTTNAFAHGSFRQFHHLVPQSFELYKEDGTKFYEKSLSDTIGDLTLLTTKYNELVRGLVYQKINFNGCLQEVRDKLFKNSKGIGIDLLSTDNSRGRDHGIPPYYEFAQKCLFKIINSFDDLRPQISDAKIAELKKCYKSVKDMDLYTGLRAETAKSAYTFGPTSDCINAEQIYRFSKGDPFFYENPLNPYPFTKDQLSEIRKASWAKILCDNSDIFMVARHAFFPPSAKNPIVLCTEIPTVEIVDI